MTVPVKSSTAARAELVDVLRLDLVGPGPEDTDMAAEALSDRPSRWYLTGYLVPATAPEEQRLGSAATEGEIDSGADGEGADDAGEPDHAGARVAFLPSSIGLSVLLDEATASVDVEALWGDYRRESAPPAVPGAPAIETDDPSSQPVDEGDGPALPTPAVSGAAVTSPPAPATEGGGVSLPAPDGSSDPVPAPSPSGVGEKGRGSKARQGSLWRRTAQRVPLTVDVTPGDLRYVELPGSGGLRLAVLSRAMTLPTVDGDRLVRAVSIFLVNYRPAMKDSRRADEAFAFQAQLLVTSPRALVPRSDLRGLQSDDWDDRVGDLHYRDSWELAVGHNVSADWNIEEGQCRRVWTSWFPLAAVPRVIPAKDVGCELVMETLGALADAAAARASLEGLSRGYRDWIATQRVGLGSLAPRRREVAEEMLRQAERAAQRIEEGIACLGEPAVLDAFRIANRAIAASARRREAQQRQMDPARIEPPRWRPFQLAFILLNIKGLVEPVHIDRETVDLLFFPTGGGKTEAYLGLAAFTIALRRLRQPGLTGAGLAVLMRYTLRLLTLDQLSRAAAVICALELERVKAPDRLGAWPIEIALWVGRAATPNRMGRKGDTDPNTARARVLRFRNNTRNPQPLPIEQCPWCGTRFEKDSFSLRPNADEPIALDLCCVNRQCDFHLSQRPLPIHAVDEPIYRRLPAFMIATVDKFASMPWTGETAGFFGGADRTDAEGFYGPATPGRGTRLPQSLLPPDLVIQDELHLISGPLGTMVGLYETALDTLSARATGERRVRPKIVASTATVRKADRQVRALFDRRSVQIFPPPGPDRRDSFFAQTLGPEDPAARHYLGVAAPGGSPKVLFLRVMVSLMAAAQKLWEVGQPDASNPADPYMTVVAYFNALRELGGARRIVEGEVGPRLEKYQRRHRVGEMNPPFANRKIQYEPVELTSRVSTDQVASAKRRLDRTFDDKKERVDVALATNMISVGLDILRLGLMIVSGQPKTTAEYIQTTSRVGRDPDRPGLVVALLNVNKPRDRSHYERFKAWHQSFYRGVEAGSVTPFSPRALDRGLAAVTVALSRLGQPPLTPQPAAQEVVGHRAELDTVVDALARRAEAHDDRLTDAERATLGTSLRGRAADLLDEWVKIARTVVGSGGKLGYDGRGVSKPLLREMLDPELPALTPAERKFRAPRSLRDVEPNVLVAVQTPEGQDLEVDTKS